MVRSGRVDSVVVEAEDMVTMAMASRCLGTEMSCDARIQNPAKTYLNQGIAKMQSEDRKSILSFQSY